MLKRRRALSPARSSSEIPLLPSDSAQPSSGSKRRRIVAPLLDGDLRGVPMVDDEEFYDEDDIEQGQSAYYAGSSKGIICGDRWQEQWQAEASEYKSTNTLLHQLHLEHRRRMFETSTYSPQDSSAVASSSLITRQEAAMDHALSPMHTRTRERPDDKASNMLEKGVFPENAMEAEEVKRIQALYDHNRMLGSVVLSRRRDAAYTPLS